ncbi:MAG: hypothetical protein JRJ12_09855 [Deltaproteobacteria bacterium]|nr:hypothetical protein [Deltaproteobacteria bacterium]MBW2071307.1 hypothetical protein [Deltaproteobacteria bacterium]
MRIRVSTTVMLAVVFLFSASVSLGAPFAYITNYYSDTVSVIDTASNKVTATVDVGDYPHAFGNFIGPARIAAVPVSAMYLLLF